METALIITSKEVAFYVSSGTIQDFKSTQDFRVDGRDPSLEVMRTPKKLFQKVR